MPKLYPEEFKRDMDQVARRRQQPLREIAEDFGISGSTIKRWMAQADVDDGVVDGMTTAEQNELVALRRDKRRLEQGVEILRRATTHFAKDAAPK